MPKKINIMEKAGLITDGVFRDIWQQAIEAPDCNAFINSVDCVDADLNVIKDQLCRMWRVAHEPFRGLLDAFGLKQSECSTRFCIPFRTVQGWALNERMCPPYIRLMIAETLGYITLRNM